MTEIIVVVATLLAIAGNVPYVLDVIRGKVKPHPYTWFVWSIVSATVFFGMFVKGAGIAAIPVAASEIFTLIIFLLSIKYGFRHIAPVDHWYLAAALLGFIPWIVTQDPTISIVIAVSIDLLAFMPTLRKTWLEPLTETPILYGSNVLRHMLILSSLQTYNLATTLHSIAMICTNAAMVIIMITRSIKKDRRT
jgi:hypothetical protein